MSAATIPFASRPANTPWSPTHRDRLIFQWVKFDGHKQSWVAEQLEIHQTTVSRIVERYERWIARGGPSQQGAPCHDERLRAQRWLAYERNEWILSSALRIAGEMERAIDTSKSTITRPASNPRAESEVRTEHKVLDRSGIASRFLRLAHRINMDQLKLVEQEPLPALEPLSMEDLGENDFPALAETPEAGRHGHSARADREDEASPSLDPSNSSYGLAPAEDLPLHPDDDQPQDSQPSTPDSLASPQLKTENRKLKTEPAPVSIIEISPDASPMHITHEPTLSQSTSTNNNQTTSATSSRSNKSNDLAYTVASSPPERPSHSRQPTTALSLEPPVPEPLT